MTACPCPPLEGALFALTTSAVFDPQSPLAIRTLHYSALYHVTLNLPRSIFGRRPEHRLIGKRRGAALLQGSITPLAKTGCTLSFSAASDGIAFLFRLRSRDATAEYSRFAFQPRKAASRSLGTVFFVRGKAPSSPSLPDLTAPANLVAGRFQFSFCSRTGADAPCLFVMHLKPVASIR